MTYGVISIWSFMLLELIHVCGLGCSVGLFIGQCSENDLFKKKNFGRLSVEQRARQFVDVFLISFSFWIRNSMKRILNDSNT